ncbi:MAG: hypothetical protein JSV06_07395 [Myxococcales bacterium]|nr:MAG: hypothetical protein JSV06_07395 [Myxococcales bacterium]
MNKSLLTIGIILSLGTVGCAGFGVQHSSSLAGPTKAERGIDTLWETSEEAPTQDAEVQLYAEQELGTLWDSRTDSPIGVIENEYDGGQGGDLWNPADVSRPWESGDEQTSSGNRFSQTSSRGLWY